MIRLKVWKTPLVLLVIFCVDGCSLYQPKYQREYNRLWKEMIQARAWEESMLAQTKKQDTSVTLYASNEDLVPVTNEGAVYIDPVYFQKSYASLVSRAYFKILAEAKRSNESLYHEFKLATTGHQSNIIPKKEQEKIKKKYKAHRAMLDGLTSWNIFSDQRTGDLDYFMLENEQHVLTMVRNGDTDQQIISFLIYKLADLYHIDEGQ